jgi:hypothetical protein
MFMAALSDSHPVRLVELRQLAAGDLNPLLDEETVTWRQSLDWDFPVSLLALPKLRAEAFGHRGLNANRSCGGVLIGNEPKQQRRAGLAANAGPKHRGVRGSRS